MSKGEEERINWSDDDEFEEEEEEEEEEESTPTSKEESASNLTGSSSSPALDRSRSPSGRGRFASSRGGSRRGFRKPREYPKMPVPEEPPFVARVTHLPLTMMSRELQDFFEGTLKCKVEKVMTRFDGERVMKGSFEVQFEDKQSLEIAIGYDQKPIHDMQANIYIPPPPHDGPRPPRSSRGRDFRRG